MKSLSDNSEFISENIAKFHDLISNYENNEEEFGREVEDFIFEIFNRAGENIEVDIPVLTDPNPKLETVVAVFIQASELWRMFCNKYKETYPEDPPYFDEGVILKEFESTYKKGLIENEITE